MYPHGYVPEQTPEQSAAQFRTKLDQLGETQYGLAKRLTELGDQRPFATILRGIQRIALGENRMSGEMQALLTLLKRERDRAIEEVASIHWTESDSGIINGHTRGFSIKLARERSGWRITIIHGASGYEHPWPKFPNELNAAKIKALICVDDALQHLRAMAAFDALSAA